MVLRDGETIMTMRALLIAIALLSASNSARADCYDVFGCSDENYFRAKDLVGGPNCEFLWEMRNNIFSQRGYCFHTQRAIQTIGNAGCKFADINQLSLNRFERANVSTIRSVQTSLHCPVE